MKKLSHHVAGIDVSARVLDIAAATEGGGFASSSFANEDDAIKKLIKWLLRRGITTVVLEATGGLELRVWRALEAAGIAGREQKDTACCYAKSDKYWTADPQGIAWESFHTLESIPTFNTADSAEAARGCCTPSSRTGSCC